MKTVRTLVVTAAMVALTATAQANLVSQGNGTVLDTTTNLIWLENWNVNGFKDWATQMAWAQNLNFAGSSDWVLPSQSEYAALYAEVGDLSSVSAFTNVGRDYYWTGTEYTPGYQAFTYYPDLGWPAYNTEVSPMYAVAVRPGDVIASVPEPETLALVLLALGAVTLTRRRRPH